MTAATASGHTDTLAGAVLLDTDVFSNLLRGGARAAPWASLVQGRTPLLSFISAGELKAWPLLNAWGATKRAALTSALAAIVILPYDESLLDEYARVMFDAKTTGHPLIQKAQSNDRWIAATARVHGVPLMTGNKQHFTGLPGLLVE